MPIFNEDFGTFEVVDYKYDTNLNIFNLCLRTFEVGQLDIPKLVFSFEINNSDRLFTKTSESAFVYVLEPELELEPELKNIPFELLPENSLNYTNILFFSLLFFIVLVLGTMIIRKQQK